MAGDYCDMRGSECPILRDRRTEQDGEKAWLRSEIERLKGVVEEQRDLAKGRGRDLSVAAARVEELEAEHNDITAGQVKAYLAAKETPLVLKSVHDRVVAESQAREAVVAEALGKACEEIEDEGWGYAVSGDNPTTLTHEEYLARCPAEYRSVLGNLSGEAKKILAVLEAAKAIATDYEAQKPGEERWLVRYGYGRTVRGDYCLWSRAVDARRLMEAVKARRP